MDQSVIAQMLQRSRQNQSSDPYSVASSSAAVPSDPSDLYGSSAPALQSQTPPAGINPAMLPQPGLEQQAQQQGNIPMAPVIASIMKYFGLLNMLRNQGNQAMVAGSPEMGNM